MARVRCVSAAVFIALALAACSGGTAGTPAVMVAQVQQGAVTANAATAGAAASPAPTVTVDIPAPAVSRTPASAALVGAGTESSSTRTAVPTPTVHPVVSPAATSIAAGDVNPAKSAVAKPASALSGETSGTSNVPVVPKPAAAVPALPARASLGPLEFISQTLNNCGPASVAEVLNYWGIERSQSQVQAILRADGNPRGMAPYGVPAYMRSMDMDVVMGVGGGETLVKALVAHGFPVIVSQWVSLANHIGHYRPIEGYDDEQGVFIASDPFLGPGHAISYDEFDQIWRTNSQRFMVLYPPSKKPLLQSVLASTGWDATAAYQADLAKLQRRLTAPARPEGDFAFWQGYSDLSIAWDQWELGQVAAASSSLSQAVAHKANPVVVDWIAQALNNKPA